jgi:hypothetical protein
MQYLTVLHQGGLPTVISLRRRALADVARANSPKSRAALNSSKQGNFMTYLEKLLLI